MIEALLTPALLALVAGVAGWRSGRRVARSVWRGIDRLRAAWAILRGRSPLCRECAAHLERQGVSAVLCSRCDPVFVAYHLDRRSP